MLYWKFETEQEAALFRKIQDENLCDYAECSDLGDANCECMAELDRRLSKAGGE